jgi:hypothetical protein
VWRFRFFLVSVRSIPHYSDLLEVYISGNTKSGVGKYHQFMAYHRVLKTENRKYKEAAHMACFIGPISQPSLDISPIWIPIISNEVNSSQRKSI